VTAPVVTPPVVVAPKPMAKQISLNQIVAKLLANGVPVLKGRSASKQVEFTASSARLDATDWATLRKVAASFTGKKGKLIVVGFVSGKGQTKTSAQKVAAARAKNVSMALVSLGVDFEIGYAGFGARNKAKPTAIDNRVDFRWIASN
jgi:outer membrane protein OmpA-like peptidoglycan-associated protein